MSRSQELNIFFLQSSRVFFFRSFSLLTISSISNSFLKLHVEAHKHMTHRLMLTERYYYGLSYKQGLRVRYVHLWRGTHRYGNHGI